LNGDEEGRREEARQEKEVRRLYSPCDRTLLSGRRWL